MNRQAIIESTLFDNGFLFKPFHKRAYLFSSDGTILFRLTHREFNKVLTNELYAKNYQTAPHGYFLSI